MTGRGVFINCPFSDDYEEMFRAAVFAVVRCGFIARCAREDDDGGAVRFEKICKIIKECRYGIHDISKTELDKSSKLPRFNMPLELGLFLGAKKFGTSNQRSKKALILDREPYRFQRFISDISGQDIYAHNGEVRQLVLRIVNWLRHENPKEPVPGGAAVADEYRRFRQELPKIAAAKQLRINEVTFRDLADAASKWILKARAAR
jgi:hypothetical protein